jgi:O-acetyl-ADP-ribose deacetylase (regulator of RNase III)
VKENCIPLSLKEYRLLIHLDEPFLGPNPAPEAKREKISIIDDLLIHLETESAVLNQIEEGFDFSSYELKRRKLYSLLTVREPNPLPTWFHVKFGELLQRELKEKQVVNASRIPRITQSLPNSYYKAADHCALWQGDITSLECDTIVNAANKGLLGCFRPFHRCIDNAIHSATGPMLREDCNTIIKHQGCLEGTGWAKITRAYNLPSKFVLHTVGPIYDKLKGKILQIQKEELSNCYKSCLNLARQIPSIRTVAFCCISTGAFGFPMETATRIALKTVEDWIETNPNVFELIIFNVFSKYDYEIYEKILKGESFKNE